MKQKSKSFSKEQSICALKRLMVCSVALIYGWNLAYGSDPDSSSGQNSLKLQKPKPAWDFDTEEREPHPDDYQLPPPPTLMELFPDTARLKLSFHHWPNKEEAALIMKYATEQGLKRTDVYSIFKVWIFEWDEPKNYGFALRICVDFPELPSIRTCSPSSLFARGEPAKYSSAVSSPQVSHYNTCNLAPDHQNYWAQNLIGADLLREELKKKSRK